VHQIGSLRDDERKLLFYMRCEAILRRSMDAGKTDRLRHVIFADEGHLYYSEDAENPINRIAKEGRKFGLAMVIGSQSPTHFSEDFLTNCGTIVLCGINSTYWEMATRKLRCDREVLASTRAREVAAIKFQRLGEPEPRFAPVNVNQAVVNHAVASLRAQQAMRGAATAGALPAISVGEALSLFALFSFTATVLQNSKRRYGSPAVAPYRQSGRPVQTWEADHFPIVNDCR
jgi:hypothetical protein